jgi:hypothetical protein
MLDTGRSDNILDGEILGADSTACVELVPVTQAVRWSPKAAVTRPDPTFVTHLIATADQAPLRRASLADAQTAYGARAQERRSVTRRTRQVV